MTVDSGAQIAELDAGSSRRSGILARIAFALGLVAALGLLAWGGSVGVVYGRSVGRVFGPDEIEAVPTQRDAVVLGCVKTLPNGRANLY